MFRKLLAVAAISLALVALTMPAASAGFVPKPKPVCVGCW